MNELYPEEEEEEQGPLWFRMLPKWAQYALLIHEVEKLIKDPETPAKIHAFGEYSESFMRIMQGKEKQP